MGSAGRKMICVCGCKYYVTANQAHKHLPKHSKKCSCKEAKGIRKTRKQIDSPRKEIIEFLKAKGWSIMVVGEHKIEQRQFANRFNFKYVMEFMGKKMEKGD